MSRFALIRWDSFFANGITIYFLLKATIATVVAILSIRNIRVRNTSLVKMLDHKPGVRITTLSAVLTSTYFFSLVVELLIVIVFHLSIRATQAFLMIHACLGALIILLAAYETLRWRLSTPREIRRRTKGGDYDLILVFILGLLLFSLLIPYLHLPLRF